MIVKANQCEKEVIEGVIGEDKFLLQGISEKIIRCVFTRKETYIDKSYIGIKEHSHVALNLCENEISYIISTKELLIELNKKNGNFTWKCKNSGEVLLREGGKELIKTPFLVYTTGEEEPVIKTVQTVDGERNFVENLKETIDHMAYKGKLKFLWQSDESIHGLGQGEEGIYNYRGNVQYLYQHNMRIPIPFFISNKGYGILVDCGCLMTFNDDARGSYLYMDMVDQLDYYFIAGESVDERIAGYRRLTGKAVMLPKWAYGYVQSKEAYHTQEELLEVAKEYRKRKIPLDCIVQDWNTWESGAWGNKKVDKKRYPNIKEMNQMLHEMNVHSMVSIWPVMTAGTDNHEEMKEKGFLFNDNTTYNAFIEEARSLYWKQVREELFSGGFDAWWCDSAEPFSGPDWNGEHRREPWERFSIVGEEHKKFLGADCANIYPVAHAKGIYENQRKEDGNKRVLNLTRAGYASSQKYATMFWSGDTSATWNTLCKQITEGLNMCMSGMPYWTLDIGGFFTVNENWKNRGCSSNEDPTPKWFWRGDYEEGVNDLGYRELYVRWLQYGAFLPMFRSHGTDTPREIWNFGEPGDMFYDAIAKTIALRYRLMPYIYSMAGKVWYSDYTMLRSLMFDFPGDSLSAEMSHEFMFGESFLICPVTQPMYYEKENKKLETQKIWKCYLPQGTDWYDFYTGKKYKGGIEVVAAAEIEQIPIFVKAGSVIPMEHNLQYAQEVVTSPLELHIYPGEDAYFTLYEDDGEGYAYEEGKYNLIEITWEDAKNELTIGAAEYDFAQSMRNRICRVIFNNQTKEFKYEGKVMKIGL